MYISKKKALQIANLINSLEVTHMMKGKYPDSIYKESLDQATKELFDLGIPMLTLREKKKA